MAETQDELIFNAKMVSDDPDNEKRTFIVRVSILSDEVKVWENESSGFRGGFFYRSPHSRTVGKFDPGWAYVGAEIVINGVKFALVDASAMTMNIMESRPDDFPFSDLALIMETIRSKRLRKLLTDKFTALDKERNARVLMEDAFRVLAIPELGINKQEQHTVSRRFQFYRTKRFLYGEFLNCLE